ncbi:MAG: NAD(P)H-dependent oxidoreductase [Firmicutes bacterium]|nr:NAD(P)H-dependent oxidoreductase [Bacillota bacterium]
MILHWQRDTNPSGQHEHYTLTGSSWGHGVPTYLRGMPRIRRCDLVILVAGFFGLFEQDGNHGLQTIFYCIELYVIWAGNPLLFSVYLSDFRTGRAFREYTKCVQDDGMAEIGAKLTGSDGFLVGSPVYFGTIWR